MVEASAVQGCNIPWYFLGRKAETRLEELKGAGRGCGVKGSQSSAEVLVVEGHVREGRIIRGGMVGWTIVAPLPHAAFNIIRMGGVGQSLGISKEDREGLIVVQAAPELCRSPRARGGQGRLDADSVRGPGGTAPSRMRGLGEEDVCCDADEWMRGRPSTAVHYWVEVHDGVEGWDRSRWGGN